MKGQQDDDGKYIRFVEERNDNESIDVIQSLKKEHKMLEDEIQITKGVIKRIGKS